MNEYGQTTRQQFLEQQARRARARFAVLMNSYPALFAGKDLSGFRGSSSVPEGWQLIICNLFSRIQAFLTPEEQQAFEPLQIKEKFGCLRFYFRLRKPHAEDEDRETSEPPLPPDQYLRIQLGHATQYALYAPQTAYGIDPARSTRLDALREIVREAEMLTEACCIQCGAQHLCVRCAAYGRNISTPDRELG